MAERFDGRNVTEESFEAMVSSVTRLLEPFEATHRIGERIARRRVHLLGTSGTVTTVAGILLALAHLKPASLVPKGPGSNPLIVPSSNSRSPAPGRSLSQGGLLSGSDPTRSSLPSPSTRSKSSLPRPWVTFR